MSAPPAVSVVVPTRNRARYLEVSVRSLMQQSLDAPYEVLVVDDASTDETERVASALGARVVRHAEQRGPNAARNTGIRAASSELIALVDDDVEAPEGWLAAIVEGARRHPDAEAFGGPIRARFEGPTPRSCGREEPPITTLDLGTDDREVEFVWGANMALRRGAVERVGEFDAGLPHFGEEEEWLTRLRSAGGRVVYLADAALVHRREGTDATLASLMRGAYVRGRNLRGHDVRRGAPPSLGNELRVLAGCGWHAARYLCPQGLVMGAHSLGRVLAAVRSR